MICAFFAGCGAAAREPEFYKHRTIYADEHHLWFSWSQYKHPTAQDVKETREYGWWGFPIEYRAGEMVGTGTRK